MENLTAWIIIASADMIHQICVLSGVGCAMISIRPQLQNMSVKITCRCLSDLDRIVFFTEVTVRFVEGNLSLGHDIFSSKVRSSGLFEIVNALSTGGSDNKGASMVKVEQKMDRSYHDHYWTEGF
ncbi:hypothetical protein TNCV_3333321 [Trichonephila clavipes]|nr:hypothetical protein TNCV_3333321 [Trichonephila clavipes]